MTLVEHDDDPGRSSGPDELLLEVRGAVKEFPGVRALSRMDLELRSGEVLALVGENGAGKSTLMKLLAGVYAPDAGEFTYLGKPLRVGGPRDAAEQGLAIIHQELNLMSTLTVAENIYIGREPTVAGLLTQPPRLRARTQELLDRLGMDLDPSAEVGTLSVAHQQMVEIAKALSYDARVLIMDEPTAALNERETESLHELIRRFITPSTGVIYISHRMEELRRIADRVQVIRDGEYVDSLPMAEATLEDVITKMVGRSVETGSGPSNVRSDRPVLLEVKGLRSAPRVKDATFDLREGEILGLAGLMGAGRTETARALIGSLPQQAGNVRYRGRRVTFRNPAHAARQGIGYLSEDRKQLGLLLDHSVQRNMELSALSDRFQRAGFVQDRVSHTAVVEQSRQLRVKTPDVDQLAKNLSGGNQQKVVIGRWLLKDCDVLIFDEPTRGIDVGAKEEIYDLLDELAAAGKSIIMISSDLPEVVRMSHRVVVMSEGRVTGVLDASEADQESIMALATAESPGRDADPGEPDEHGAESMHTDDGTGER